MTIVIGTAIVLITLAAVLGFVRIGRAPDDATRAVVADLLFFCVIAVFALAAMMSGSAVLFDVLLIATLLGILTTVALARMLTRGRR